MVESKSENANDSSGRFLDGGIDGMLVVVVGVI